MDKEIQINGVDYISISNRSLLHGMYCDSDVYCLHNETPVLFCSKTLINNRFFEKLKNMHEKGTCLFVEKNAHLDLLEQHQYLVKENDKKIQMLKKIRMDFGKLLDQAAKISKVNMDMITPMVSVLDISVKEFDMSFLIYWTSYMRDMDAYLQTHCTNVAIMNGKIAQWMHLSEESTKKAIIIGLLHDLGKMKIPDEILNKPGKLDKDEFEVIKKHPLFSYEICQNSGIKDIDVLQGVRGHHEKINGTGYPDGLITNKISLFAKITGISDIYDAMVAQRVYKDARTPFEVLNEFLKIQYGELDLKIVQIFLEAMRKEMVGKVVILSNGKVGRIRYMEDGKFLNPIIEVDCKCIALDDKLKIVTLCTGTGII